MRYPLPMPCAEKLIRTSCKDIRHFRDRIRRRRQPLPYRSPNTVRLKGKDITLAPLTPQFWGEMTLVFGFLPPKLGGRGG
jgi:hypothetical protein